MRTDNTKMTKSEALTRRRRRRRRASTLHIACDMRVVINDKIALSDPAKGTRRIVIRYTLRYAIQRASVSQVLTANMHTASVRTSGDGARVNGHVVVAAVDDDDGDGSPSVLHRRAPPQTQTPASRERANERIFRTHWAAMSALFCVRRQ